MDVGSGGFDPSADDVYRGRPVIGVPERFDHDEARVGQALLEAGEVGSDLGVDGVRRLGEGEVVVEPRVMITMSGCCLMMRSGRSPVPKRLRLRMKPRPLWLGLNSRQP